MGFSFLIGGNAFNTENRWAPRKSFEKLIEEKFGLTPEEKYSIEEAKRLEEYCRENTSVKKQIKYILQMGFRRQSFIRKQKREMFNRGIDRIRSKVKQIQRGNQGHYKIK